MCHIQRIHLALIVALAVACTSTESVDVTPHLNEEPVSLGFIVSDLTALWWDELRAKKERGIIRERQRSNGKRVCEEGEWPQRWVEDDCRVCGCDEGDVRWCTGKGCWDREAATRKLQESP